MALNHVAVAGYDIPVIGWIVTQLKELRSEKKLFCFAVQQRVHDIFNLPAWVNIGVAREG
jgi:hypothetical protein